MRSGSDLGQSFWPSAEIIVAVGKLGLLADQSDWEIARAPALADPGVEHGSFPSRISTYDQQRIGGFDAGDGGVEQIGRPAPRRIERHAVLAAVDIRNAE